MQPISDIVLPSMPGPWKRPLAFLDSETTGLWPSVCNVIDVAVIRDGAPWESKVKISPFDEQRAASKARESGGGRGKTWQEVTGYTREEWADAPSEADVAPELARQLHGAVLVAHNADFDVGFLSAMLERHGIAWRSVFCGSMIDTYPLAKAVLGRLGLHKFSLDACCEFLKLEREGHHRAMGGALRVRQVFHEICKLAWRIDAKA